VTETRSHWGVLAAYGAASAANQMLWLTFAAVTTASAQHFHTSVGAIGWLSQIFPLAYVVLAVPAGMVLDRWFRPGLAVGALLTGLGGLVRVVGTDYGWLLAGQVLVAVGQPFVLNAVTQVSGGYLPPRSRANGIAASSAALFAGMVVALAMGAAMEHDLDALVNVQAVLGALAAIALVLALRVRPVHSEATSGEDAAKLAALLRDRYLRQLVVLVFLGFGIFVAVTTWLQALLEPAGVSSAQAGVMLVVLVLAGVASSAILPGMVAARHREIDFLLLATLLASGACLLLAIAPGVISGLVGSAVIGLAMLATLPVVLTLVEHRAGSASATGAALVWLSGNLGGLVAAVAVQALVPHPSVAFALLGVVGLAAGIGTRSKALRTERAEPLAPADPAVPG
jgi:predicted MFS family arabinose efflux permease